MVSRGMGRSFQHFKNYAWFPLTDANNSRAEAWFAHYGVWSLLFSWAPVIDDPLTVVAGMLRVTFGQFLLLVMIGKVLR